MKKLSVGELKAQFSDVITDLREGREVVVTYGRNKEPLATLVPYSNLPKPNYSMTLGDLKSRGWGYTLSNFEMSDEELLGL